MDFDVLPGPSLPERARTTLARAATATVSTTTAADGGSVYDSVSDSAYNSGAATGVVPVRSTWDGMPVLLPAAGSPLALWLTASTGQVRVSLPAQPPFSALRLTGATRPVGAGCLVAIGSIEFTGGAAATSRGVQVPVEEYRAPGPTRCGGWRLASCAMWSTATWASLSAASARTGWRGRSG